MAQTNKNQDFFLPNLCQANAVLALILITELSVLAMVLAATGVRGFSWHDLALASLFVQWIVLLSALLLCLLRQRLAEQSLLSVIVQCYLVVMVITLVATVVSDWVLDGANWNIKQFYVDTPGLLKNLLVSMIITGMALRYWYLQDSLRKKERAELQARIQALQSRIRPHFLFNSMNIIASLISSDPENAERVVENLSDLFRASLTEAQAPVSLEHEIELGQRYVEIEQLRLGDRLKVEWLIDEHCRQADIPLLTLQPLLENAVYHGIQPRADGGLVTVEIKQEKSKIRIQITNPVPEEGVTRQTAGNSLALNNIRARLQAVYGGEARLRSYCNDQQFVTELILPFREERKHC